MLQFAVVRLADDRAAGDLAAVTAMLADAAATTGQPEARAGFAYALGETVRAEQGPHQAMPPLRCALALLEGLNLPIIDTLVRHRTAAIGW